MVCKEKQILAVIKITFVQLFIGLKSHLYHCCFIGLLFPFSFLLPVEFSGRSSSPSAASLFLWFSSQVPQNQACQIFPASFNGKDLLCGKSTGEKDLASGKGKLMKANSSPVPRRTEALEENELPGHALVSTDSVTGIWYPWFQLSSDAQWIPGTPLKTGFF